MQTIIIWNLSSNEHISANNEQKIILKDHDHTVECIAWAPESAFSYVCEAAGTDVSFLIFFYPFFVSKDYIYEVFGEAYFLANVKYFIHCNESLFFFLNYVYKSIFTLTLFSIISIKMRFVLLMFYCLLFFMA